ncbi:undecaprenyl-diphosphate phosphatase [bacterium]|nr:undecaprenyl-diphosphate phosphatase [candidate division CSSED10-310 bacterium]
MTIFQSIVLGIVQGLTEFLPVSSSGHLVIAQKLFELEASGSVMFDVALHAGTLVAVVIYFRRELMDMITSLFPVVSHSARDPIRNSRRLILGLFLATLPVGLGGFFLKDFVKSVFESSHRHLWTGLFLCVTGCMLFLGEWISRKYSTAISPVEKSQFFRWIGVGFAQLIALLPGVSRSGATISAGLMMGWSRTSAAQFSFLMMIPAVTGAVVSEIPELISEGTSLQSMMLPTIIGTIVAGVSGYAAIHILLKYIKHRTLFPFGAYCFFIGLLILLLSI